MTAETRVHDSTVVVPLVSVVIASYNSRATIADCLASLRAQVAAPAFEVIVVDSSGDDTAALVRELFPEVHLIAVDHRLYPGNARNLGVSVARAQILAFTDADCTVSESWIAETVRAHRRPLPLIGGALGNGAGDSMFVWARYFCELAEWMPGRPAGEVNDVPTGCMTLKRWAFEKYGPFPEDVFGSDTMLCWRLGSAGHQLFFDPAITAKHCPRSSYGAFLRREIVRGRRFGAMRAHARSLSAARRWLFAVATPVAIVLRLLRKSLIVRGAGRYRREFILCAPLLLVGIAAWYLGQASGLVAGAADVQPPVEAVGARHTRGST